MQKVQGKTVAVEQPSRAVPRSFARIALTTLLSLALLWLLIKALIIGMAAQSLLSVQTEAEAMLAGGITELDGNAVEQLILDARADVLTLKAETAVFTPFFSRLGWVPKVGPTLLIAPQLLEMADAGTETAAYAIRGLKPALPILQSDQLSADEQMHQLLQIIDLAEPDLQAASRSLERVVAIRSEMGDVSDQPWRVQSLFGLADEWLPVAQTGLQLLPVVPEMAGIDGAKSYLLLAQNEDELRSTGGFISSAGVLTVENGRIVTLELADAYRVDDFTKPYADPPSQLYDLMGLELFVFRDANFWPDFPTSAEQSMALYSYGTGTPPLDGTIAINQQFLQTLIKITGPLPISELDTTVTNENILEVIRASYGSEDERWFANRKNFIGYIAAAVQTKLLSDFSQIDPMTLASETVRAAQQKEIQLYMLDPQVNNVLNEIGWDGRLEATSNSDFLLVADQNMGFNKANLFVEKAIEYRVTVQEDFTAVADLTITYQHSGTKNPAISCAQDNVAEVYFEEGTYSALANLCYWNYLRIYTPASTALRDASLHEMPAEQLVGSSAWSAKAAPVNDLAGWTVFGNFINVPVAQSETFYASYQLPRVVQEVSTGTLEYNLHLVKQSGTTNEPMTILLTLPDGYRYVNSSLPAVVGADGLIRFSTTLDHDQTLSVRYAKDSAE